MTPPPDPTIPTPRLHRALERYFAACEGAERRVPASRRRALDVVATYVRRQRADGAVARLVFICTHNSRRSHMAQLFAHAAFIRAGILGVETYSGGTEATAVNPRAVEVLRGAGFRIEAANASSANPRYRVTVGEGLAPLVAFSKQLFEPSNPRRNFAAVMTCADADIACPVVEGADVRVALPYVDPKRADPWRIT